MISTPIGNIVLSATASGLSRVDLVRGHSMHAAADDPAGREHIEAGEQALDAYFKGKRDAFRGLTLAPEGTAFQLTVWKALRGIPYGETISYRELAERIGNPAAMRAVGLANGRNPLPIIVPCHRVIGANGTLTGFGLGVDKKAWLLVHEGAAEPFSAPVTLTSRVTRHTLGF